MAAPTINLTLNQASTTQPYQPVSVTCGMSRSWVLESSEFTQVGSTTEWYYNLDPALLSSNTQYNMRGMALITNGSGVKSIYMREGTIASLPTLGYGFGDEDSIGFDTLYIRLVDGLVPADDEVSLRWDESLTGEEGVEVPSLSTVEWWLDLTDGPTATAVAGWASEYRYTIDHRDGSVLDMAGVAPTSTTGSPIRGWAYCACLPEGTLKLKCRITNSAGLQTTATQTITVAASTRTVKTVKASGGDYTTLLAAVNAASADWEIVVEGGHTESTSGQILMNDDGVFIRWDGVGDMPEISMADKGVNINQADFTNIYGIKFIANHADTLYAVQMFKSKYNAVVGCEFVSDLVSGDNRFSSVILPNWAGATRVLATEGTFIQGITVGLDSTTDYVISGNSSATQIVSHDMIVVGCNLGPSSGPSLSESTIRDVAEFASPVYMYNRISEDSKDGIRQTHTEHSTAHGNRCADGTFRIGSSSEDSHHKAKNLRVDSNLLDRTVNTSGLATIDQKPGGDGIVVVNNIFTISFAKPGIGGADAPGVLTDVFLGYGENTDIYWNNNSFEIASGFGTTGDVISGSGGGTSTYVTNNIIQANAILYHGTYVGTPIVANAATASLNQSTEATFDSDFLPATEPNDETTHKGILYDYWGNVRRASSYVGAVDARADGSPFASSVAATINIGRSRLRDRSR